MAGHHSKTGGSHRDNFDTLLTSTDTGLAIDDDDGPADKVTKANPPIFTNSVGLDIQSVLLRF